MTTKTTRPNSVVALRIISESEIAKVIPNWSASFETDNPTKFKILLSGLGVDVTFPYQRQDGLTHRNMLNEVVLCSRWVGQERLDEDWINSGYASQEAIDKASGSRMVESVYRARGLTEDMQAILESRDKYTQVEEQE